ncbi:MAG: metalloregulator ArsR/SmtB family transcription factor [Pseudomonadales bacterium]
MAQSLPAQVDRSDPDLAIDRVVSVAKALADGVRALVLRVLQGESYGVLELCRIVDVAQPALSHHLKVLHQTGLVVRRREGNSLFYRRAPAPGDMEAALLAGIDQIPLGAEQLARIDAVHGERRCRSEAFFTEHADDFARNQARISESGVYAASVMDIVQRHGIGDGTALEIGPGDGELLAALAERFTRVVGIDSASAMLARCRERVADADNVRLMHRDFAELPARRGYQLVLAAMVVHHLPSPQRFFHQAGRLLKRDGVLVVVELCSHDQEWARPACGDLWLGFEPDELGRWAAQAGLHREESQYLAQKNGFRIQIHTYTNPR